jgi:hypothetical protein
VVRNIVGAVLIGLLVSGCAQPPVQYLPDSQQRVDIAEPLALPASQKATIEISTNTFEPTTFYEFSDSCSSVFSSPSTSLSRQRLISDAESAITTTGLILSLGLAKPWDPRVVRHPKTVVREVPASKSIVLGASSYLYSNTGSVSCGPLRLSFEPQAGNRYRIEYRREAGRCALQLLEIDGEKPIAVPQHQRWTCSGKGFLGLGAAEVVGLRTFQRTSFGDVKPGLQK